MPGGRGKSKRPDPLKGFQSEHYGSRAQLEETMAAGGGAGGGQQTLPAPGGGMADGAGMVGDGGVEGMHLPFTNPMLDESGNVREGGMDGPHQPVFPDDPDLLLRALFRAHRSPDILNLLEGRTRELYEGADLGGGMGGMMDEGMVDGGLMDGQMMDPMDDPMMGGGGDPFATDAPPPEDVEGMMDPMAPGSPQPPTAPIDEVMP